MTRDRVAIVAIWALCLSPIAIFPGAENRWLWATNLGVGLAVIFAAWAAPAGRLPRVFALLVTAVVPVLLIAALAGADPVGQIFGRAPRYEGLVSLPALFGAAWAGARLLGPGSGAAADPTAPAVVHRRRHAIRALTTSTVMLAAVALLESVGLRPIESDLARPGSLAGNATDQGILGAIAVAVLGAVCFGAWQRTRRIERWSAVGVVAGTIAVATSASRAAVLALALVALCHTARALVSAHRRRRALIYSAGVIAVGIGVILAVPLTRDRLFGVSGFAQQTVGDRLIMWSDASRLISDHPWLGVGPNGFADAITPYFADGWFQRAQVGSILDSPHNALLQSALAGGAVGAALAVAVVVVSIVLGVRNLRSATGARRDILFGGVVALPAAGIALLTHVTSPTTLVPLAMLTGVLVAVTPATTARARVAASIVACAATLWTVFVLVSAAGDVALHDVRVAATRGDLARIEASLAWAHGLRPWDVDVDLEAARTLGAAVENGLAGAADPAAAWAERAVERLPGSSQAQYVAGMVASIRGDAAGAIEHLGRAAELSPADPRIHHELGVAALGAGDLELARVHLERALELAPDSQATAAALRDVCSRLGDACGR